MSDDRKSEFTCPRCGGHTYGSHQLEDGTLERMCHGYAEKVPDFPKPPDGGPGFRRTRIDLFTPAEKAIYDAMCAVEMGGADERLTNAVILLGNARELVADFVDGIDRSVPQSCGFTWHQRDDEKYGILPPEPGVMHAVSTPMPLETHVLTDAPTGKVTGSYAIPTLKVELELGFNDYKRAVVESPYGTIPTVLYYNGQIFWCTGRLGRDAETVGVYEPVPVVRRVW